MGYDEVKRIEYSDKVWASERKPSAALTKLLTAKDHLIVLRCGGPPFRVTLGVPHQAAVGVERICEQATDKHKNRVSDEGAASYALVAYTALRDQEVPCKLVVMAHATTHNPNKAPDSPYWKEVFADDTELLFECHGAASGRRDLELSAGSNHLMADPLSFGRELSIALGNDFELGVQKQAGQGRALVFDPTGESEGNLKNPAIETCSLIEAEEQGIAALHLEATPEFRKSADKSNPVPPNGLVLGRAIAQVIIQYLNR